MIGFKDLSGLWAMALQTECTDSAPQVFTDSINLPDSVSNSEKSPLTGKTEMGFLTDTRAFEGYLWVKRCFEIVDEEAEKDTVLFLERTRISTVFLDGRELSTENHLTVPHRHSLGRLTAGRHELMIRVANVNYPTSGGHMTSPDTQTNWLGIVGRIELRFYGVAHIVGLRAFPDVEKKTVRLTADVLGAESGTAIVLIEGIFSKDVTFTDGKIDCELKKCDELQLWDEYSRKLYRATVKIDNDFETISFGVRNFSTEGMKILCNGKQLFLRGKHDGMLFPETGYAPMTKPEWLRIFAIAKQYGINHYRFHTCCPPEAAFEAADEAGIYLEPELPFWGTMAAKGDPYRNEAEMEYLINEGFSILSEYGNHPSFFMLSMGNELWGDKPTVNEVVKNYKLFDNRHLYTAGSNNFQFFPSVLPDEDVFVGVRLSKNRLIRGSYAMCDAPLGHIQTEAPSSAYNYNSAIRPDFSEKSAATGGEVEIQYGTGVKKVSASEAGEFELTAPIITHEVGQYNMYPDFSERKQYHGAIQPLYLDVWEKELDERGMLADSEGFFKATSRFAAECYKLEIEAAIGSEELSGFQLLDLQDFTGQGVALVGILNSHLNNKGAISADEWRGFCGDLNVLLRFPKFVYGADEKITAEVVVANSRGVSLFGRNLIISVEGKRIALFSVPGSRERLTVVGTVEIPNVCTEAKMLKVTAELDGAEKNSYRLWLFPSIDISISSKEIVYNGKRLTLAHSLEEARALKQSGNSPLIIPERTEKDLDATYCTDFWNYHMFRIISESMKKPEPIGTMGLYIDTENPALRGFPTELYSTPQWYSFVSKAFCKDISGESVKPIVRMIDNIERKKSLGLLYEIEGIPVCTARLWEASDLPEIRQLAASITDYYA